MKCSEPIKQLILYGIFGILTTVINIFTFKILVDKEIHYVISNIVAFIISVIFAYITNRKFVFYSKVDVLSDIIFEFIKFTFARISTLAIDVIGLIVLVEILMLDTLYSKIFINIIVVIINYILSKKAVFK